MSLKTKAKQVQKAGHKNSAQDSMLAHINPQEAGLLQMFGGSGRTDPKTGLKHFDWGDGGFGGDGMGGDGFGGGDSGAGDGGTSGSSGWGGEPGGDRSDGGIGMGDGYGGGDSLSFDTPVSFDNSFATSDNAMSSGDFNNAFGDYGSLHGDVNNYSAPEGSGDSSFLGKLTKFAKNMALNKAIGTVTQSNPVLGMMAPMAMTAINANDTTPVGQQVAGSMVNAMMGPLGMVPGIANLFGANIPSIGQSIGQANLDYKGMPEGQSGFGNSTTGQTGTGMNNLGSTLGGLAGLYGAYRNYSDAGKYTKGLQNMFGQNSPYAQQLRQQLERRDAAGGRRSQYGPREVELQAKLAQMAAGLAPSINQGNQNQFNNQIRMMQMLGNSGLLNGLGSMFSGWGSGGGGSYVPSSTDMSGQYSGDSYGDWGLGG